MIFKGLFMVSRFRMQREDLYRIMKSLKVINYQELCSLYSQKIGFTISPNTIKDQLSKEGFLSNSYSGHIAALEKVCNLEDARNEMVN